MVVVALSLVGITALTVYLSGPSTFISLASNILVFGLLFLNAILILSGPCSAHECFDHMRQIENEMGRHRALDRFAPRPIDCS